VGCVKNHEVNGPKCEEKERMWRNRDCKERGGQCKEKGKCDDKGEQKPYILFGYSSFVQYQTFSKFSPFLTL
jgi:hypothetical protein